MACWLLVRWDWTNKRWMMFSLGSLQKIRSGHLVLLVVAVLSLMEAVLSWLADARQNFAIIVQQDSPPVIIPVGKQKPVERAVLYFWLLRRIHRPLPDQETNLFHGIDKHLKAGSTTTNKDSKRVRLMRRTGLLPLDETLVCKEVDDSVLKQSHFTSI